MLRCQDGSDVRRTARLASPAAACDSSRESVPGVDLHTEAPPHVPAAPARRGHPGRLIAIFAVIAALAIGWPLASRAFSGSQPLRAGSVLTIGPDSSHRAQFTVGPGWVLKRSDSNPKQNYVLQHGAVRLNVIFVFLLTKSDAPDLWSGLGQLLLAANAHARLTGPAPATSSNGARGQAGILRQDGQNGTTAVWLSPRKTFAIEMISLGPPGARAAHAAAQQVIRSAKFPAAGQ